MVGCQNPAKCREELSKDAQCLHFYLFFLLEIHVLAIQLRNNDEITRFITL